ncbi:MAG: hypothetical protein DRJ69_07375, partial [Thermoprotei archaeon]
MIYKVFYITFLFMIFHVVDIIGFGGLMIYLLPLISCSLVLLVTLKLYGYSGLRIPPIHKTTIVIGLLIAMLQIVLLIDAGFLMGFGRSPYSHTLTGVLINSAYVLFIPLTIEYSRAYVLKGVRKPLRALILTASLYTFLLVSPIRLLGLLRAEPLEILDFLGLQIITTFTWNLLASVLVLLAGPLASLAYRVPIEAFWRFSPILPNLTWGWKVITGVVPPIVGFTALIYQATPSQFRKLGIRPEREGGIRTLKRERREILWTTIFCIVAILAIWFATGLLGVFPSI